MADVSIQDLLDHATKEQLIELARGGIGEAGRAVVNTLDNDEE